MCIQPCYLVKNCRASYRGRESKGSTTHKKDLNKSNARQITITAECGEDQPATNEENSQDPLSLLYSDSEVTLDTVAMGVSK